tara:strand:- start:1808 stop:2938 length:1131 start_codon:yes stop_codon:yes gene_type:complete
MATTYLTLTNNVLNELNESELTSSTFSSSRGIQTSVKKFVLKAMHEIYNGLSEIPDLYLSTTQDTNAGQRTYSLPSSASPQSTDKAYRKIDWQTFRLVPKELVTNGEFTSNINSWTTIAGSGSAAYNSGGNGRARLNDYAIYQSISTVKNKDYKLQVRAFDSHSAGQALKVQVGTSAEDTTNLNTTLTVEDFGAGAVLDTSFTATAQTTYITLNNTVTSTNLDIDYVRISENIPVRKLKYLTYDDWNRKYLETDLTNDSDSYGTPSIVYPTQDKKFGLSPVPDKSNYTIQYEYWKVHTDLSAHDDTMDLDDRFKDVIINRAKYYAHILRSDLQSAQLADREFKEAMKSLRVEYINNATYMTDHRVNHGGRVGSGVF